MLKEAILNYGTPKIFNIDQGLKFTAKGFMDILFEHKIQVSMDGEGRALDNVFIERFWSSVKYEYIYLVNPSSGMELYDGLINYLNLYNRERIHQSLGYRTSESIYMATSKGGS